MLKNSLKMDLFRIIRILSSLRKGSYWINYLSTERLEYNIIYWRNLKTFQEIQSNSNTYIQIFIILTTIFIALLEMRCSNAGYIEIFVIFLVYLTVVIAIGIILYLHNKKLKNQLNEGEFIFKEKLKDTLKQLSISYKQDEIVSSMTELSMIKEIVAQVTDNRSKMKKKRITEKEKLNEIDNWILYAEELEKKVSKLKKELEI